ncbi:MAG: S-layer homology domain-containing protein [Clostridiales bacterium]|nr:S-layer homology domain-containing protein [Clostridiales bacterium]
MQRTIALILATLLIAAVTDLAPGRDFSRPHPKSSTSFFWFPVTTGGGLKPTTPDEPEEEGPAVPETTVTPTAIPPSPTSTPTAIPLSPTPTPTEPPEATGTMTPTPEPTKVAEPTSTPGSVQTPSNPSVDPASAPSPTSAPSAPSPAADAFDIVGLTRAGFGLDTSSLESVIDSASALKAAQSAISSISEEARQSAAVSAVIATYFEEVTAKASTLVVDSPQIELGKDNLAKLVQEANKTIKSLQDVSAKANIELLRPLRTIVCVRTDSDDDIGLTLDPSLLNVGADLIRIESPSYSVTIPKNFVTQNVKSKPFEIFVTTEPQPIKTASTDLFFATNLRRVLGKADANGSTTVSISFDGQPGSSLNLSMKYGEDPAKGVPVISDGTNNIPSIRNPVTNDVEAKIYQDGEYTVVVSYIDFTDIEKKAKEMRDAVEYLAANGVITGTSEKIFSPDLPISRAEIAMLMTKTIGYYKEGTDGHFTDVFPDDWYFSAAGSAKEHKIMAGTNAEGTLFSPKDTIPREQIVAICSRALTVELKYVGMKDPQAEVDRYADGDKISKWAVEDIALASKVNLVPPATNFHPEKIMTRGDVAVLLQRLYLMIWM